jgi:hypothetical protein
MTATIGSGSANVSLTSMTGDVTLLARPDAPAAGPEAADSATADSAAAGQGDQR